MTAGHIGNRHSRLHRFLNKSHLLLCGIPAPALNTGKHFDSISIRRHSRITRRTPSSYLSDCVRFKWGLLQRDLKFLVERMTRQEHAMALVRAIEYRLGPPAEESSA